MRINTDPRLSNSTAGLRGLTSECNNIVPHHLLLEREREWIRENTRDSFTGVRTLATKAAGTIALVKSIGDSLSEGAQFFIPPEEGYYVPHDPVFKLRQLLYEVGRKEGFDRLRKVALKNHTGISRALEISISREELTVAVDKTVSLEKARVALGERITQEVEGCFQLVAKDTLLAGAICAFAGIDDVEAFVADRREDTRKAKAAISEWCYRAGDAGAAFGTTIEMDGWLGSMAELGKALEGVNPEELQSEVRLPKLISPERKVLLAGAVTTILDRIAKIVRDDTQLPICPRRDTLHALFLLEELQKDLPSALRLQHERDLATATKRLLGDPQATLYMVGIEQDPELTDGDKQRLFDHFERFQIVAAEPATEADTYEPVPHEKRTAIRRQILEAREAEKFSDLLGELLRGGVRDVEPASTRKKDNAEIRFFSPVLEREFMAWTVEMQPRVKDDLTDLMRAACAGERVDFKPIQIETKVFELRLLGPGLRVYCTRASDGDLVVLAFGTKKEQRADIRNAVERYRIFSATDGGH